ncbi:predicted protein [Uncinocarpus reesii 1704]|uniref:Uncharacterized protein n=1 Tax=Uncinocarpus reesii (strain UAMH 1704) TaxID=336963 RepID=C4JGJ5_UNCRE|nr:uncharacterized protein UREG_01186 [Uncinocarpus reesii 1704]EEP76337.1 predicted protein [Uncinocarpus reesii 1704]
MEGSLPRSAPLVNELAMSTDQRELDGAAREVIDQSFAIIINASKHHRSLQEKAIAREFKMQRDYTDIRFEALERQLISVNCGLHGRFGDIDRQFGGMSNQFGNMDRQFGGMGSRFKTVDERFREVEQRFAEMEHVMDRLSATTMNSKADRPMRALHPISAYQPDRGYHVHEDFPKTVGHFWNLKKKSRLPQLISLSLFYGVSRDELIEPVMSQEHSVEQVQQYAALTRKELIERFPESAHMALADRFGLKYHKVAAFMSRLGDYRFQSPRKRSATDEATEAPCKVVRTEIVPQSCVDITSEAHCPAPRFVPFSENEIVPLEFLVSNTPSTVESVYSDRTQLGWEETVDRQKLNAVLAVEAEEIRREEDRKFEERFTASLPYVILPAPPVSVTDSAPDSPYHPEAASEASREKDPKCDDDQQPIPVEPGSPRSMQT